MSSTSDNFSPLDPLIEKLAQICQRRHIAVAVAESCTAGMLSMHLSSCQGASAWFLGGVVCYQEEVKHCLLGVEPTLIEKFGVVSQHTALAMATGLSGHFPGAVTLSVTGWLDNAPVAEADSGVAQVPVSPGLQGVYPSIGAMKAIPAAQIEPGSVWFCVRGLPGPGTQNGGVEPECLLENIRLHPQNSTRYRLRSEVCAHAVKLLVDFLNKREG